MGEHTAYCGCCGLMKRLAARCCKCQRLVCDSCCNTSNENNRVYYYCQICYSKLLQLEEPKLPLSEAGWLGISKKIEESKLLLQSGMFTKKEILEDFNIKYVSFVNDTYINDYVCQICGAVSVRRGRIYDACDTCGIDICTNCKRYKKSDDGKGMFTQCYLCFDIEFAKIKKLEEDVTLKMSPIVRRFFRIAEELGMKTNDDKMESK